MIYRRPIREVVEERHGRTCGLHVFVFYIVVLTAMLAMSTACLSASDSGYFVFQRSVPRKGEDNDWYDVKYRTDYGWRLMCAEAEAVDSDRSKKPVSDSGCFALDEKVMIDGENIELAAGSAMTADTGLAVALGHAASAIIAATHILFFVFLYFNIDPVPVRGYLYMRGLGLMTALSSFYLLFTCVVSFFFGVKGSLDLHIQTSAGLRPSWAYIVTVINVTLMVVIGTLACQDDEVDIAIATPQYTSSARNEDTVKRANGKLLQMRSRSSDTISEGPAPAHGQQPPFRSPKAAVEASGNSRSGVAVVGVISGAHPAPSSAAPGQVGGVNSISRSSSLAASAAAHGAFASGLGHGLSSPVPSSSVVTSWTEHVSALSPVSRANRPSPGRAVDGDHDEGDLDDVESGDVCSDRAQVSERGRRKRRDSGSILDSSLLFNTVGVDDETNATGMDSVTPKIREGEDREEREEEAETPVVDVEEEDGSNWNYAIRSDADSPMNTVNGDTPVTTGMQGPSPPSPATQSDNDDGAKTRESAAAMLVTREGANTFRIAPGTGSRVDSSEISGTTTSRDPCVSEEDALECGDLPASPLQRTAQLGGSDMPMDGTCGGGTDVTPPPSARLPREECV